MVFSAIDTIPKTIDTTPATGVDGFKPS